MCTIFTMIIFVTISISFQSFADCVKKICQAVSPCLRMTDKISDLKEKKIQKISHLDLNQLLNTIKDFEMSCL